MPTHSVGSAQVKEDRQRAASYSAHFPPPVLREIRYRKRTGKDGLYGCPEHAKSIHAFLTGLEFPITVLFQYSTYRSSTCITTQ